MQAKYAVEKIDSKKININEVLFDGCRDSYVMQNRILEEYSFL